jgi:uncharacterized protein YjiS (DUF1127 family)
MFVTLLDLDRLAITENRSAFFLQLCALADGIAEYFLRRSVVANLREFDDRALLDIGLVRSEIKYGRMIPTNRARVS